MSDPIQQENSCCVNCLQSEGCVKTKSAGLLILTALTIIGTIAVVLLVLAEQGYNLAGINSIAQMIPSQYLYLGVGVVGVALILNSVLIGAQINNQKANAQ